MLNYCGWALANNGFDELYVKQSVVNGKGLFISKNIPSGTILYQVANNDGVPFAKNMLIKRIGPNISVNDDEPYDILRYINHSCRPNAELNNYGQLINTSFLFAHNEIFINYMLMLTNENVPFTCCCGQSNCCNHQ
jgi:hypothetical protein